MTKRTRQGRPPEAGSARERLTSIRWTEEEFSRLKAAAQREQHRTGKRTSVGQLVRLLVAPHIDRQLGLFGQERGSDGDD